MEIESITGESKKISCIGCSIISGEISTIGGIVFETDNFFVVHDFENPIPGFLILSSKKHVKGLYDFNEEEALELIKLSKRVRDAMKEVLFIDQVTIIQEEESDHFHIWFLPIYEWMKKIGTKLGDIPKCLAHSRNLMKTPENIKIIEQAIIKIKDYHKKECVDIK